MERREPPIGGDQDAELKGRAPRQGGSVEAVTSDSDHAAKSGRRAGDSSTARPGAGSTRQERRGAGAVPLGILRRPATRHSATGPTCASSATGSCSSRSCCSPRARPASTPTARPSCGSWRGSLEDVAARIPPGIDWILRVDGHTDRQPIRDAAFRSNWELSAARAISVIEFLMRAGASRRNILPPPVSASTARSTPPTTRSPTAATGGSSSSSPKADMPPHRIILDCDPGQDDAVAILLALASPDEIEILAVTTVAGNVPLALTTRNAQQILAARRPIATSRSMPAAPRPILRPARDGRVRARRDRPQRRRPARAGRSDRRGTCGRRDRRDDHAPSRPASITLCPTGPLTNIALAIIKEPEIVPRLQGDRAHGRLDGAGQRDRGRRVQHLCRPARRQGGVRGRCAHRDAGPRRHPQGAGHGRAAGPDPGDRHAGGHGLRRSARLLQSLRQGAVPDPRSAACTTLA